MQGILKAISPKYLEFMIDKGYMMIESTFYAIHHPPTKYYETLDPKEAHSVERVRMIGEKVGVPLLGMMRMVARQFPYKSVKEKITPEWLKKRGMEKFPELVEVIDDKGTTGDNWLEEQCREIVQFATGRIAWSDEKDTMVEVPGVF